jgi:cyclase
LQCNLTAFSGEGLAFYHQFRNEKMEIFDILPFFTAFIRPEDGANVGLFRTSEGMVLIDTTSSPVEMNGLLNTVHIRPDEVRMVVNTHFHTDHTWGNQIFTSPILAHRLCREIMETELRDDWSPEALEEYLSDLEKTDPKKASELRSRVETLEIKLPDQIFEDYFEGELGGVVYQVIHEGGHTPDSSIVWLPEKHFLYAADLLFQGRYPFVFDADIPAWVQALSRLKAYHAEVIIPGHGVVCTNADITWLSDYLQQTWELTSEHITRGHTVDETCMDPAFPIFAEGKKEKLHAANIRYMYEKLSGL